MLRARRFGSITVVAALGLLALSGCRSDPSVAAYVGSTAFAEAQVTRLVDEFLATVPQEQRAGVDRRNTADQVLHILVLDKVVSDYAAANDIDVQPPDMAGVAQQNGLRPDGELTRVLARYSAALSALSASAKSVKPTEADQREAYQNATIENQPVQEPFEQVQQLFDEQRLGQTLGMRKALVSALEDADVAVNPRYDATYRLPVQIENARSWFAVELAGSAPVRDDPADPARQPQGTSDQG